MTRSRRRRRVWWIVPDGSCLPEALRASMPAGLQARFRTAGEVREHLAGFLGSAAGDRAWAAIAVTAGYALARDDIAAALAGRGLPDAVLDRLAAAQAEQPGGAALAGAAEGLGADYPGLLAGLPEPGRARARIVAGLRRADWAQASTDVVLGIAAFAFEELNLGIVYPDGSSHSLTATGQPPGTLLVSLAGHWHATVPADSQPAGLLAGLVEAERAARAAGDGDGDGDGDGRALQHARAVTDHNLRTWHLASSYDRDLQAHLAAALSSWRREGHLSVDFTHVEPLSGGKSDNLGHWLVKLRPGQSARWAEPSLTAMGFARPGDDQPRAAARGPGGGRAGRPGRPPRSRPDPRPGRRPPRHLPQSHDRRRRRRPRLGPPDGRGRHPRLPLVLADVLAPENDA